MSDNLNYMLFTGYFSNAQSLCGIRLPSFLPRLFGVVLTVPQALGVWGT